ncbi:DUF3293 domain-containing protein [Luteolibacter marinus]|uniref:DUF3293 domain-containing protein n=1 Tax=Luteolibacter marinus TaxID=2776705 RepID=UPI001867E0E0|nr:DUF3293 domain-containing protein [Luteolibacter marinus]
MEFPAEYRQTVFHLEDAPDPLPACFAIITAHNPRDRLASEEENRRRNTTLLADLEQSGAARFTATGASPDGLHREPGWAVVMAKHEAIATGRLHQQTGIWWIELDQLVLITCDDGAEFPMGSFSSRVKSGR